MTENQDREYRIRLIVGILISIVVFAILLHFVNGEEILAAINQVRLIYLIPIYITILVYLIARSAAWRTILRNRISLTKSFLIINAGYFVNNLFPFRLGEVTRAFLLLPSGFSFWEALPAIILERMIDVLFAVALFLYALPFAINVTHGFTYASWMVFLVLVGFGLLFFLVKYQAQVLSWLENIKISWTSLHTKIYHLLKRFISGLGILTEPWQVVKVFLLASLGWIIAILYQYLLLKAFLPEAQIIWAVFALGALAVGVSVPSSPGNVGVYEASITLALIAFGVDRSVAFTYALTSHVLSLTATTLIGAFALVREGYAIKDILQFRNTTQRIKSDE